MSRKRSSKPRQPNILVIDNGGSRTRSGLYLPGGESQSQRIDHVVTYGTIHNYDEAIKQLAATSKQLLRRKKPDAVGVSIAGRVRRGGINQAGALKEYGWCGKPFVEDLAAEIGVDVGRIALINDCVAGAKSEQVMRDSNAPGAYVTLSTGFGAALYNVGKSGRRLMADEPGHQFFKPSESTHYPENAVCTCGETNHVEAYIGGGGIELNLGRRGEAIPHDKKDGRWKEIKGNFHEAMDLTLQRWVVENDFWPNEAVAFTGSVAMGGPDMLGGLEAYLKGLYDGDAPRVERAVHGEDSCLYGAAFTAEELLEGVVRRSLSSSKS